MRYELPFELGRVQVLRQGLGADVRPCLAAREDEGRARVRRKSLFFLEEGEDEGRQRHAVLAPFFHGCRRDGERVAVDPLFAHRCGFAGAEHRRELKEKEHLQASRRLRYDAHDGWKFLPVDGRHRRHDWRSEDPRNSFDGVVLDESRANCEVENLSGAHDDPFERRPLSGTVKPLDGVDDEGRRDLVELSGSDRPDEVAHEAPSLILIGHDAPALETAPQLEGIAERVTRRRSLTDLLFLSSRELSGLRERQGGKVPEKEVSDFPVLANSQDETLRPCWLNLDGETSAEGDCESLFLRVQCRDFLGGKHGVEEIPRYR